MPATDDQTFEHFVPGRASAEAFAAATALARAQPGSLRLLMLCGPPGVGKTHLFRAVVNMVRMRDRSAEITETTAFDVIQDRIARRDENAPGLRVPHAEWLVLDDLHVLAGKPVTQAEVGRLLE